MMMRISTVYVPFPCSWASRRDSRRVNGRNVDLRWVREEKRKIRKVWLGGWKVVKGFES